MEEAETRPVASWGPVRDEDVLGNQAEWKVVRLGPVSECVLNV